MTDSDPVMHLRCAVEEMLTREGFEVLDIVTHDMDPEDGDTEWIVSPHRHNLLLSNNFGALLRGPEADRARAMISDEIRRLRERMAGQR